MVSKYRRQQQKCKQWHSENKEAVKSKSRSKYVANRESVKKRSADRMLTDKPLRRQNLQRVKSRIENDAVYKHRNRTKAAESGHRKLQNVEYREKHKATMGDKMKTAYHTQRSYCEIKKTESRQHYRQVCKLENYKSRHRSVMRKRRHGSESCLDQQPPRKTKSQTRADKTYWARRTRLIAAVKENHQLAMLQKKMASLSGVPLLDTKLLTKKAAQRLKRGKKC